MLILNKVFDIVDMVIPEGISVKREILSLRKELTREENKLTLSDKTPEA